MTIISVTPHHKSLRYGTIGLSCLIFSIGNVMFWSWLFQCQPAISNFLWSVDPDTCINYDYFRWGMLSSKGFIRQATDEYSLDYFQCPYRFSNHERTYPHPEADLHQKAREESLKNDLLCNSTRNCYMVCSAPAGY